MDTSARLKKTHSLMRKIELHQDLNRIFILCSLGAVIHALTCFGTPKKLNTVDYLGVPACAVAFKRARCLSKKEEQGLKIWHTLQAKTARQG